MNAVHATEISIKIYKNILKQKKKKQQPKNSNEADR